MLFGKRTSRPQPRRPVRRCIPGSDPLERRDLLSVVTLQNGAVGEDPFTTPPRIDGSPTDPPTEPAVPPNALGVQFTTAIANANAGLKTAYVGDVNGDNRDDFLISAPDGAVINGLPTTDPNASGRVYLVFGSRAVGQPNGQTSNFLNLVNNVEVPPNDPAGRPARPALDERVAALEQLGNAVQTSPINANPTFPFDGIEFVANLGGASEFGASIGAAGDVNNDGFNDFLIGAPGANNDNGVAFLIYGSPSLTNLPVGQRQVDLGTTPTITSPVVFTTISSSTLTGARIGQAVSGVNDVITDGIPDVAIGAPEADIGVNLVDNGAAFLLSGNVFASRPVALDLAGIGTVGNNAGILFVGESSGDNAGFSVSTAGNFDGDTVSGVNLPQFDLLIGAPGNPFIAPTQPGQAYLVYGSSNLVNQFTLAGVAPVVSLADVGDPAIGPNVIPGIEFLGESIGDLTGFAVSTAGDFNGSAPDDIMIGSPGFAGNQGRVNLIYGRNIAAGRIVGELTLSGLDPAVFPNLQLEGIGVGSRAGFSLAAVRTMNTDQINEILIGSPGFMANSGATYLVAGNPNTPIGETSLQVVAASTGPNDALPGIQFILPRGPGYLGSTVSGTSPFILPPATVDSDNLGDFLTGAPFDLPPFPGSGSAFLLEGAFVPLATPVAITADLALDKTGAPSPAALGENVTFTVTVTNNGPFDATGVTVTDTLPGNATFLSASASQGSTTVAGGTLVANLGALSVGAIATIDIVVQPLSAGSVVNTATVAGNQVDPVPGNNTDTISVIVGGGGGGFLPARIRGFPPNAAAPRFGEALLPEPEDLSGLAFYKPLPFYPRVYRQFLAQPGFAQRFQNFFHPDEAVNRDFSADDEDEKQGIFTLPRAVFTRGRFKVGEIPGRINHRVPTLPLARFRRFR